MSFDFVYGIFGHVEGDFYVAKFIRFFYIGVLVPILKGLSCWRLFLKCHFSPSQHYYDFIPCKLFLLRRFGGDK